MHSKFVMINFRSLPSLLFPSPPLNRSAVANESEPFNIRVLTIVIGRRGVF